MKKYEVLIPTKQYSNIKFTVECETEEEFEVEVNRLYKKWFNYFEEGSRGNDIDTINTKIQTLVENAREGKASDVEDYQEAVEDNKELANLINEAKKAHNRDKYKESKQVSKLEFELDLQHESDLDDTK